MTPTRTTITLTIAALILSAAASLARADELPPIPLFRRWLPMIEVNYAQT